MIPFEISCRKLVMMCGCILVLSLSGCVGGLNQNRIAISYTDQIQKLSGGVESFWPENGLKTAFLEYWNLRYSDAWRKSYEQEAPYFQEIVSRTYYERVIKGTVANRMEGIEIRSIQKISDQLYEIQIVFHIITSKNEKHELYFADRWVFAGKNWYHVMRDAIIFPKAS